MTSQFRMFVLLVPVLVLFTGASAAARSLAAVYDSLTRARVTWNAAQPKHKQIQAHNLDESERKDSIEPRGRSMFGRIQHYVGTHRELLASDALLIGAFSADAVSSVKCQHEATPDDQCIEGNKLLGIHPSELTFWGYFTGLEAISIAASHVLWHKHPDSPWRHISWALPIVYSICEIPTVRTNLDTSIPRIERLREARARLAP